MELLEIIQVLSLLSFVILTFAETIVVAANGWKVGEHSTPVYYIVDKGEFCKAFWNAFLFYGLAQIVTTVLLMMLSAYVIGWFALFNGVDMHQNGITVGFTILMVVGLIIFGINKLYKFVTKSKPVKAIQQTKLSKGVSNWYHQFKNKYCPILERE